MDLRLAGAVSGVDAIRAIHAEAPDARIIVLTMYSGDEDIHRALAAGATAYLLKDTLSDDLLRVIREVHAGGRPVSADVKALLDARSGQRNLTRREIEVLELVAMGKRNKEIAVILGMSLETVPVHLKHIFAKLDVTDAPPPSASRCAAGSCTSTRLGLRSPVSSLQSPVAGLRFRPSC